MIITIGGMNKDIKKLQAQIKILQDLVVSQGKRISELEENARPTFGVVGKTASALLDSFERTEIGMDTLTPSPSPSKPRMDKGRKGDKNK